MKWPAILILVAIISAAALQPIIEFANVLKEKIVINAAMVNSSRAAQVNAVNIWGMMDMQAHVDEERFAYYFAEAFSQSLNLTLTEHDVSMYGGETRLRFSSNDERFNDFEITVSMERRLYDEYAAEFYGLPDRYITVVTINLATPYYFRTYWLRTVNGVSNDDYLLEQTRSFMIQVIN